MKKRFDAVKMARDIRDKLQRKTKNMSRKELTEFYRQAAVRVNQRHGETLKELAK
ncbi:MAG: hypothetical protein Q7K71_04040 [Candidatus Omnitrophota bacterium]|nr:hypothetical protein [Candidatus Omnitrophota bacterium]